MPYGVYIEKDLFDIFKKVTHFKNMGFYSDLIRNIKSLRNVNEEIDLSVPSAKTKVLLRRTKLV